MNQNIYIPNFPSYFINNDICIIFKSVWGSTVGSDLDMHWELWGSNLGRNKRTMFSKTFRTAPVPTQPPTQWKPNLFSGSKVAGIDSLNTHILLEASIKISTAIPPLNMSANMAHIGTTLFYLYLHTMYISLKMSHPSRSYWGTFLNISFLLHAHYMHHLVYLHWSYYINLLAADLFFKF